MVKPAQTDRPDDGRGKLADANSLAHYGSLVSKMMRGSELAHAKIIRGAGGWHVAFFPKRGIPPPPDDEFINALGVAVKATGPRSRRALGMKRALHDRVVREMVKAGLWTDSTRGASPVACSTLAARQAWLQNRNKKA